jgi:hypothetical protein
MEIQQSDFINLLRLNDKNSFKREETLLNG